jgi:glycosyltransferase involved in cell wall biosynthesis
LYPLEILINIWLISSYIFRIRKNIGPIVVNVHGVHNIAPAITAWLVRIPVVLVVHESMTSLYIFSKVTLFFVRLNKGKILSVSSFGADIYKIPNATIVYSPINSEFWFSENKKIIKIGMPLKIVFVGNINVIKNLEPLLMALKTISFDVNLKIVGDEVDSNYAEKLKIISKNINKIKKNSRITYCGWKDSTFIKNVFSDSDIIILTSTSEGCPLSIIEGIASGCFPLVTCVGDMQRLLGQIASEFLIDGFDQASIRNGIIRLKDFLNSSTPTTIKLVKNNLRKLVEDKFMASNISNIFYREYLSLVVNYNNNF